MVDRGVRVLKVKIGGDARCRSRADRRAARGAGRRRPPLRRRQRDARSRDRRGDPDPARERRRPVGGGAVADRAGARARGAARAAGHAAHRRRLHLLAARPAPRARARHLRRPEHQAGAHRLPGVARDARPGARARQGRDGRVAGVDHDRHRARRGVRRARRRRSPVRARVLPQARRRDRRSAASRSATGGCRSTRRRASRSTRRSCASSRSDARVRGVLRRSALRASARRASYPPSSSDRLRARCTACSKISRQPFCSRYSIAACVVPPGDVTRARSSAGPAGSCDSSSEAPTKVW